MKPLVCAARPIGSFFLPEVQSAWFEHGKKPDLLFRDPGKETPRERWEWRSHHGESSFGRFSLFSFIRLMLERRIDLSNFMIQGPLPSRLIPLRGKRSGISRIVEPSDVPCHPHDREVPRTIPFVERGISLTISTRPWQSHYSLSVLCFVLE